MEHFNFDELITAEGKALIGTLFHRVMEKYSEENLVDITEKCYQYVVKQTDSRGQFMAVVILLASEAFDDPLVKQLIDNMRARNKSREESKMDDENYN